VSPGAHFSAHNKISEIVRCLKYSLVVLYGKLYGTKLCMFLHVICESASRIRHIGLENLKNYCRSFSSSRAQKRCAPGDTAPLRQARESLSLDTPSVRYITYLRTGCTSILRSRYFFVFVKYHVYIRGTLLPVRHVRMKYDKGMLH
jgi:hypothetical protein